MMCKKYVYEYSVRKITIENFLGKFYLVLFKVFMNRNHLKKKKITYMINMYIILLCTIKERISAERLFQAIAINLIGIKIIINYSIYIYIN